MMNLDHFTESGYQLAVAVTLTVTAIASLVVLLTLRHPNGDGAIRLPTVHDEGDNSLFHDPLDVTRPEEVIDGYPINEVEFWNKVWLWKLVTCLLLGVIVVLQTISSVWTFLIDGEAGSKYAYTLQSVYALYTTALAGRAVHQNVVDAHATYIIHLATLTSVPTVLLVASVILQSPGPVNTDPARSIPLLPWLFYVVLLLYCIATYIVFSIPTGPALHFPLEKIYPEKVIRHATSADQDNVCGVVRASLWDYLLFGYANKVVKLGQSTESLEIGDFPILPGNLRASYLFATMKRAIRTDGWRFKRWQPKIDSGWRLGYQLLRVNILSATGVALLSIISACLSYASPFFIWKIVSYLESDPERRDRSWGWFYVAGLFFATSCWLLVTRQLWSLITTAQVRLHNQLSTVVFSKMLLGKNFPSLFPEESNDGHGVKDNRRGKQQFTTLMTRDIDNCNMFIFSLTDLPVGTAIDTLFLYRLLGVSCFVGLALPCLFLPVGLLGGVLVWRWRPGLDMTPAKRAPLMDEVLGAARALKFTAWERYFQRNLLQLRDKELRKQKSHYMVWIFFNAVWEVAPILVTIVSFWHFAAVRGQTLTPSIAFISILVFNKMICSLNLLPQKVLSIRLSFYSLCRIERYLHGAEVLPVPPLTLQVNGITFQNATIRWPQDQTLPESVTPSAAATPRHGFLLLDLTLSFPDGELSLVCGQPGSGKTLMLHALLGEADLLSGQVTCLRSPPDILVHHVTQTIPPGEWVVRGVCAYVPQTAWLQNASIKENILFGLPCDEERYQKTLRACLLVSDLLGLDDGDESKVGETRTNLSTDQKTRVCLARAVYSRASVLLLDDVLSAVDPHMTHHLYHYCLRGDLMRGRTIILISHHVQLCMSGARYIVVFDNGRVLFQGSKEAFQASDVAGTLTLTHSALDVEDKVKDVYHAKHGMATSANVHVAPAGSTAGADLTEITQTDESSSETSSIVLTSEEMIRIEKPNGRKVPWKRDEAERRPASYFKREIWEMYFKSLGGWKYWTVFVVVSTLSVLSPVVGNWWLKTWSSADSVAAEQKGPGFYITVYAIVTLMGVFLGVLCSYVLYTGSINASSVFYKRLLEAVLFSRKSIEDTVSRECLLECFERDFETIDNDLVRNFGRSIFYGLTTLTSFIVISVVDGIAFVCVAALFGYAVFNVAKAYSHIFLDMKRLGSVIRPRLHSICGETFTGVTILRAFGASSKFLRDMIHCADMVSCPFLTGFIAVLSPSISASLAGFVFVFALGITNNVFLWVQQFVGLEHSMLALDRVKEYSDFMHESGEFVEPSPPAYWPSNGHIKLEDLTIRYKPNIPDVLHHVTFEIMPGEKVGILGRAGSGKSTLALSFFRIVEATEGRIFIDGIDISKIGLTDLRSRIAIITHEPAILSGTLRSTIDTFDEYTDAEIFEALRCVHLLRTEGDLQEGADSIDPDVFRNLDSPVSAGGENFSTGEKLLLSIARTILKRPKVLLTDMDEATASLDYMTDALISKTIRSEFATSTILTITRRPLPVIDYDRIMVLDAGHIVESGRPATLIADRNSRFYKMCKSAGREEFSILKKRAGVAITNAV